MSRAAALFCGATKSSRSRISTSACEAKPLSSLRSESPGTNSSERIRRPAHLHDHRLAHAAGDELAVWLKARCSNSTMPRSGLRFRFALTERPRSRRGSCRRERPGAETSFPSCRDWRPSCRWSCRDGNADHQSEREQRVDQRLAPFASRGEIEVDMQRLRVERHGREQHVVALGHGLVSGRGGRPGPAGTPRDIARPCSVLRVLGGLIGTTTGTGKPVKRHGEPIVNHFCLASILTARGMSAGGKRALMVVSHFLKWIYTAKAGERAAAAGALARAYVDRDLPFEDRCAAEAALTLLLDDPSAKVRHGDGRSSVDEPPCAAADDQGRWRPTSPKLRRWCWLARRSLTDADLIDRVASGQRRDPETDRRPAGRIDGACCSHRRGRRKRKPAPRCLPIPAPRLPRCASAAWPNGMVMSERCARR